MMGKRLFGLLAILLLSAVQARADVITFGTGNTDQLGSAGPQVEGAYTYQATGDGWEIENALGNPPSALATFFNGEISSLGDSVEFSRTDGGDFNFDSVDYSTIGTQFDQLLFSGYLNGNLVDTIHIDAATAGLADFHTVAGFGGPIDQLVVSIDHIGDFPRGAMLLDNLTLSSDAAAVPEPSSIALLAIGGFGAIAGAYRRRRQVNLSA